MGDLDLEEALSMRCWCAALLLSSYWFKCYIFCMNCWVIEDPWTEGGMRFLFLVTEPESSLLYFDSSAGLMPETELAVARAFLGSLL